MQKKQKKAKGKGIFGDTFNALKSGVSSGLNGLSNAASTVGKSAYYVGSKVIDPFNDLSYGEIHAPKFGLKGGIIPKITFSRTAGPGTHIIDRIKEKRLDNDPQGKISQAHDIRYILQPDKERQADNQFIKKSSSVNSYNPFDFINQQVGNLGILAKVGLEKVGLAKTGSFASTGGDISKEDRDVLQNHLSMLEKEGYGHLKHSITVYRKKKGKGFDYGFNNRIHKGMGQLIKSLKK